MHQTTMMMDDEVYEAAAGLKKGNPNPPPSKMNEEYLLTCRTRGVEGNGILHVAAQHGNAAFIETTLPQLGQRSYYALLCQPNSKGETPLHLAAESGDKATVDALLRAHDLSHGFVDQKKLCWREKDKKGDTPLHRALRCGYEDIALLLLDRDGDLVSFQNNACESVAYLAANSFCLVFLRTILDRYYSCVSFSGPRGMTVFHAARRLTEEIMSDLIEARNELLKEQDEKGKSVLHYAVEENIELMVKKLLEADSSLACVHDKGGMTPLHRAASSGCFPVLRTILELSPQSILEVTGDGKTALHVAIAKRDACFVRVCLWNTRMKELINVADNQGNTPLHLALAHADNSPKHLDVDVDVADSQRNKVVHLALVNSPRQLDVADALLQVDGINWRLENNEGLTPLDLCQSNDKIPLKLKSLTREWRRVKEGVNMELFSSKEKIDLGKASWDELLKYRGPYGDNILHLAARDKDMMELITRAQRESNSDARVRALLLYGGNSRGETPLHMAAAAGKLAVVKAIVSLSIATSASDAVVADKHRRRHHHDQLEVDIIDVENDDDDSRARARCGPWMSKSENGDTPAHKALRSGHDDVALYLLNLDPSQLASSVTNANESLLYLAAQHACRGVVHTIVSTTLADHSTLVFSGPHGQNPLHAAARSAGGIVPEIADASFINMLKSNVEAISTARSMMLPWVGSLLIDAKLELLNKVDSYGKTPLHYAAELGQPKAVRKLLMGDKSAAFVYDSQGFTPLLRAAANGHGLCTHFILKYCPRSIELPHATSQKTALHLAKLPAKLPLTGCLDYTLEKCMKKHAVMSRLINEADAEGNTPLHCAILESDQDKALLLLSTRGVKLDIRNNQDQTPGDLCRQLLSADPKQRAIWIALESAKVGERMNPGSMISCIKRLLAHNDLLLRSTDEDLMKLLNNLSIAATLLVTLTFAATFAIPGGYTQGDTKSTGNVQADTTNSNSTGNGLAVRMGETDIKLFVASNVVAMVFGIGVLLKYTVGVISRRGSLGKLTLECLFMLYCALLATIVAFISGVYAIVADDAMWIATVGTVLSVLMYLVCVY